MNYLRIAGIAILAAILMTSGYKMGARAWKAKYDAEVSAQWQQKAKGEEVARQALERQLADSRAVAENNSTVIVRLQNANSQIIADRDNVGAMVRRLLASSARSCPSADSVPAADGGRSTAGTSETRSDGRFAGLLANAVTESKLNNVQLDALIGQIRPQLEK